MFAAILGTGMLVACAGGIFWISDRIERYMANDNICEEFTVFTA